MPRSSDSADSSDSEPVSSLVHHFLDDWDNDAPAYTKRNPPRSSPRWRAMKRIDADINAILAGIRETTHKDDLSARICVLRHKRNEQAPVSMLPTELLVVIFSLLLIDQPQYSRFSVAISCLQWLGATSQVCSHWRGVIIGCPSLWTQITARDLEKKNRTDIIVGRARGNPLVFHIDESSFWGRYHSDVLSSLCHASELHAIAEEEHRNSFLIIGVLLSATQPLSNLRVLVVDYPEKDNYGVSVSFLATVVPNLEVLHLPEMPPRPWTPLHHPNLVKFCIISRYRNSAWGRRRKGTFAEILHFLSIIQGQLQVLWLGGVLTSSPQQPLRSTPPRSLFPRITSLIIYDELEVCTQAISALECPALDQVQVWCDFIGENRTAWDDRVIARRAVPFAQIFSCLDTHIRQAPKNICSFFFRRRTLVVEWASVANGWQKSVGALHVNLATGDWDRQPLAHIAHYVSRLNMSSLNELSFDFRHLDPEANGEDKLSTILRCVGHSLGVLTLSGRILPTFFGLLGKGAAGYLHLPQSNCAPFHTLRIQGHPCIDTSDWVTLRDYLRARNLEGKRLACLDLRAFYVASAMPSSIHHFVDEVLESVDGSDYYSTEEEWETGADFDRWDNDSD